MVNWPEDGRFQLDGLENQILSASLLVDGRPLEFTSTFDASAGLRRHTIRVPKMAPDPSVSVITLTVAGAASMEQSHLQQNDGSVLLDAYTAIMHDKEPVPDKPRRALDFKMFTVPLGGEGIMPGRMLSVDKFNQAGQALSWDFRLVEPGTYEVAVITLGTNDKARLRASVAGQAVESVLHEREKMHTIELASEVSESLAVLGTVEIGTAGMQTLSLEVAADIVGPTPLIRAVKLLPVAQRK